MSRYETPVPLKDIISKLRLKILGAKINSGLKRGNDGNHRKGRWTPKR